MAHKTGPWRVEKTGCEDGFDVFFIIAANGDHICDADEDDARLIAAAPELLEACKGAVEFLTEHATDSYEHPMGPTVTRLTAAILDAEGSD